MEPLSRDELAEALAIVGDELERVEVLILDSSRAPTPFLTETAGYLAMAGGKRIRPALVLIASLFGTGPDDHVRSMAAAVEMTHLATLYHDDVIDDVDLRRGVPTANEKWNNTVAILSGDYLLARASKLAAAVGGEIPKILAEAIGRVVQGQMRELEVSFDASRTIDHYFTTIKEKTGVMLEASARVGALLGGCTDGLVDDLVSFGSSFGVAFQIADDLLDVSGDQEALGKPPGTDLRLGVYTLPVILAVEEDERLRAKLGGADPDVDEIRSVLDASGSFDRAREIAAGYVREALAVLAEVPDGAARRSLERITRLVVDRVPSL